MKEVINSKNEIIETPLISIVIPVYNRFYLLEKTLNSVKLQDYQNFELIIIDDCSDEILDIDSVKRAFSNTPVTYYKLTKNFGPGYARRIGKGKAQGKYIAYLDSDDEWDSKFLSRTINILESNITVSMVFTNVLIKKNNQERVKQELKEGDYDFFELIFTQKRYWATGAALWRAEISKSEHWKSIRDHEDYVHDILSLAYNPSIYFIPETLSIVNKNDFLGIQRSSVEMLKGLYILLDSKILLQQLKGLNLKLKFIEFIYWRISKRCYNLKESILLLRLVFKQKRWSDDYFRILKEYSKLIIKNSMLYKRIKE